MPRPCQPVEPAGGPSASTRVAEGLCLPATQSWLSRRRTRSPTPVAETAAMALRCLGCSHYTAPWIHAESVTYDQTFIDLPLDQLVSLWRSTQLDPAQESWLTEFERRYL